MYSFLQKPTQANFPEAPLFYYGSEFFGTSVYTNGQQKCCGSVYAVTATGGYRTSPSPQQHWAECFLRPSQS